jgi:beta-lactamase class D
MKHLAATLVGLFMLSAAPAGARTVCTVIADGANGEILFENGDCRSRVTPASTFKIALSLIGYDTGFLTGLAAPVLPFKKGYPDWGGTNWTQQTDPRRWMKYSVVWYSQQITAALGADRIERDLKAFGYGNADFGGDPGRNNGLERAWISSSLKIAPVEQVTFLRNLVNRTLPVAPGAIDRTMALVQGAAAGDGWVVTGKTGSAYPRMADGRFDPARSWGWFVGWAQKGDRTLVFARLNQDERRESGSAGIRARNAFLKQWPDLAATVR